MSLRGPDQCIGCGLHHPVDVNVDWEWRMLIIFFFECSLYDNLRHDLMAEVQSGWADSGNDIYLVHCTLELLLMPCMDDWLSRPSCERIISAGRNYIKRSRRQL